MENQAKIEVDGIIKGVLPLVGQTFCFAFSCFAYKKRLKDD